MLTGYGNVYNTTETSVRGRTHTHTHTADVYLDLFRKGRAEHHGLSHAFVRHGVLFNDASYLRFESHVQHAICFVQDQVAAATEEKVVAL